MVELPEKRETADWIQNQWNEVSERRAAKLVGIPRSTLRSRPKGRGRARQEEVKQAALEHPRYGYRRITQKLREKAGRPVSRRNVQRIYESEESLRQRGAPYQALQ